MRLATMRGVPVLGAANQTWLLLSCLLAQALDVSQNCRFCERFPPGLEFLKSIEQAVTGSPHRANVAEFHHDQTIASVCTWRALLSGLTST